MKGTKLFSPSCHGSRILMLFPPDQKFQTRKGYIEFFFSFHLNLAFLSEFQTPQVLLDNTRQPMKQKVLHRKKNRALFWMFQIFPLFLFLRSLEDFLLSCLKRNISVKSKTEKETSEKETLKFHSRIKCFSMSAENKKTTFRFNINLNVFIFSPPT